MKLAVIALLAMLTVGLVYLCLGGPSAAHEELARDTGQN